MNERDVLIMDKKIALVTGSARGIGRAIAMGLAKEGARLVINYQSRQDAAEEVARAIIGAGGEAIIVKADVASDAEVKAMVEKVEKKWGTIDILVNNAGVHRGGRIQNLALEDWDLVIKSTLGGTFHCCRHIVPRMVEKNWGRIINISSYAGLHGYPGDTAYGAAKSGLLGFTKSLAKEVATKGITVNAVIPGFVPTDMTSPLFNTPEKITQEVQRIPIRRPGKPEEIAEMVNFLAFRGEYITGTVIRVDGGLAI
jgi:3-oxoacyl-[acyl-carrier protein] reductase